MLNKFLILFCILTTLMSCKVGKRADLGDGLFAGIKTSQGEIIIRLEYEKAPITVANFVSLAEGKSPFVDEKFKGKKFYDGLIFHRIIQDFMIQGGDPNGNGTGNPGYKFMDEFNDSLTHDRKGILSSANSGPNTNGSQFFITHKATPWLDGKHTVFGEVVEGIAVVDSIANIPVGAGSVPVDAVNLTSVEIIRNGKEAKKFDAVEIMTDYFDNEEERIATLAKEKAAQEEAMTAMKAKFASELAVDMEKAKELPTGLKILSLEEGSGAKPNLGQKVMVMYAGYLSDGTLFDSNLEEIAKKYNVYDERRMQGGGYMPIEMDYNTNSRLIAGFREGLLTMKVGDKVRLFIPPHLGYGAQGGGPIPPDADLVFDLELVSIK